MRKRSHTDRAGFSVIELLVVVLILLVLATIAVIFLSSTRRTAREGRAVAHLKTLVNVETQFYISAGKYGVFDDLYTGFYLFNGQFTRNVSLSGGGGTTGAAEIISDGTYNYSLNFTPGLDGFTLDADPKPELASLYRRFRYRMDRVSASAGSSGAMGVILVASPSTASPPATSYKPFNP